MAEARRRTGPVQVILAGLVTAGLTSLASGKAWFLAGVGHQLMPGVRDPDRSGDMPLALALSLVVLAGWGALLVTRGRVRRLVASAALLAALGVVACVVAAPFTLPDQVRGRLAGSAAAVSVSPTGWFVTAAVAAVLAAAVLVVAFLRCPSWPTMSSRYDAPARSPSEMQPEMRPEMSPEMSTGADLWKALDEGRDPTDPATPSAP